MDRQETIIRVSFHEAPLAHQPQRRDFYFGCLSAIYEVFTPEQVGCKVQNLWNANIRVGSPYVNRLCVISREPFVRKTREKPLAQAKSSGNKLLNGSGKVRSR